jgi:hypothetical protein
MAENSFSAVLYEAEANLLNYEDNDHNDHPALPIKVVDLLSAAREIHRTTRAAVDYEAILFKLAKDIKSLNHSQKDSGMIVDTCFEHLILTIMPNDMLVSLRLEEGVQELGSWDDDHVRAALKLSARIVRVLELNVELPEYMRFDFEEIPSFPNLNAVVNTRLSLPPESHYPVLDHILSSANVSELQLEVQNYHSLNIALNDCFDSLSNISCLELFFRTHPKFPLELCRHLPSLGVLKFGSKSRCAMKVRFPII